MIGSLTPREIDDVLSRGTLGRVACIADGRPYVVPVNYVYDGESSSVFVHSAEGRKVRAMRANPEACFETEDIQDMTHWRMVIAQARFEELWPDRQERVMDLIRSRFAPLQMGELARVLHAEIHPDHVVRPVLYRLRLLEKSGRFERT